jgi:hypothetical protein
VSKLDPHVIRHDALSNLEVDQEDRQRDFHDADAGGSKKRRLTCPVPPSRTGSVAQLSAELFENSAEESSLAPRRPVGAASG